MTLGVVLVSTAMPSLISKLMKLGSVYALEDTSECVYVSEYSHAMCWISLVPGPRPASHCLQSAS